MFANTQHTTLIGSATQARPRTDNHIKIRLPDPNDCAAPVWWPERCAPNPIPSRTRPLNAPAPMVLCLKARESRSPPDLPSAIATLTQQHTIPSHHDPTPRPAP